MTNDAAAAVAKSLQSCPTLCDPIDGSPPGSTFPGILQARILEWLATPSSRGSSQPRVFVSDGQSIGTSTSASVLPMNIQD